MRAMLLRRCRPTALSVVFLSALTLGGCAAPLYTAESIHGRVIDAETKEPLPGAVVVAQWVLTQPFRGSAKPLQVKEVTTDSAGEFRIPSWGPRLRPCFTRLDNLDPWLLVFSAGYQPKELYQKTRRRSRWSIARRSDHDGATIELEPFRGDAKARFRQLSATRSGVLIAVTEGGYTFPALQREMTRDAEQSLSSSDRFQLQLQRLTSGGY